jgi:hypothetical protein
LSRLSLAFRSFFSILFKGELPPDIAAAFDYVKKEPPKPVPPPAPVVRTSDGALQMLGILQRDARLLDFLMEDISAFEDDQVGAAVRTMHSQCRESLNRYVQLGPVIDGVEGSPAKLSNSLAGDPSQVKLLGNVPANGKASGGTLRHKGWKAEKVDLPPVTPKQNVSILAPAEVEIE